MNRREETQEGADVGARAPGIVRRLVSTNFPALTHANFRYFWFGQCISLIGTWMQNTGQSWLVLTLTNSPFKLGLINAMQFTPLLLFSLFAGVFIDRMSKKKILIFTQSMSALLAFTLSVLALTHKVQYWHIVVLAVLLGTTNAIDNPTRQSFMMELVGREDLMNAIALNSTIFNGARIVGPAVAGVMMGWLGAGWCFLLNGISFIPVVIGIIMIKPLTAIKHTVHKSAFQEIGDGLRYIRSNAVLMTTVLLVGVVNILALNNNVLIPVLAREALCLGATGYGFLLSAMGVGSLIGALGVAVNSRSGPGSKLLRASALAISGAMVATGLVRAPHAAAISLGFNGLAMILFSTNANSTMQINSKDEFRGRVMSVYSLVFGGTTPIGSLISGSIAGAYGASAAYISLGIATAVIVSFILHSEQRRAASTPDESLPEDAGLPGQ